MIPEALPVSRLQLSLLDTLVSCASKDLRMAGEVRLSFGRGTLVLTGVEEEPPLDGQR